MDRRIKILYTIPNFKTAGSQYVLLSLFRKINKDVFDPYICIAKFPETVPAEISEKKWFQFEWKGGKFQDILNFRRFLKNHKIEIVHSWDYTSNYVEALACRLAGVKYIYTKKNNAWSKRWQLKSLLSHHIAYDNPEMKMRFFDSTFLRNKILFIPHGVETSIFKPLEQLARKTFNIACMGNIGTNKNQLFIIQALKDLPTEIHLHLYGNEEKAYRKKINEYIFTNSLSDRVHFNGFIANKDVPTLYRNIDLFVLASLQEGLPVSILEAMACGVPTLSSDSGGGAKYLLDLEYIFSLEKPNELTDKILRFYNMDENEKQGLVNLGRDRICNEHSSQKEVLAYEALYKKLVKA